MWGALQRIVGPRRYAGLADAAISFLTGDNPYVTEKICRELGWQPSFDARTAIARSVHDFSSGI